MLLVGSFGNAILRYGFDAASGQILGPPGATPAAQPSWLLLHPSGRWLYATHERGGPDPREEGELSAFELGHGSTLRSLNRIISLGDQPTHLSISPDHRYLFSCNYAAHPEGSLSVVPIAGSGHLSGIRQHDFRAALPRDGMDLKRQASSHPHSSAFDRTGERLYLADLGHDQVRSYRYRSADDLRPLTLEQVLELPAGSGPRSLLVDPRSDTVWLSLELSGQLAVLVSEAGGLRLKEIIDLAPSGFQGAVGAGALHLSADGRFLHAINRGDDNHLMVYGVDAESRALSLVQRMPTLGRETRELTVTADGRFLLLANQGSDRILVFRRDPQSGWIGDCIQQVEVHQPSCLVFVDV